MTKKINILLNPQEIHKAEEDYECTTLPKDFTSKNFVAREAQKKMWTRLIELGMINLQHDCTNWERTGHSPDHSPVCRQCRIKKELGIKDD